MFDIKPNILQTKLSSLHYTFALNLLQPKQLLLFTLCHLQGKSWNPNKNPHRFCHDDYRIVQGWKSEDWWL